jgi:sortase A
VLGYRRNVTRRNERTGVLLAGVLTSVLLVGCSGVGGGASHGTARPTSAAEAAPTAPATPRISPSSAPVIESAPTEQDPPVQPPAVREPRRSHLGIPALRLRSVPVVRYTGTPDDAEGTRIQNRGPAASPRGAGGGVGPGAVGNFMVTGHRTSHSAPFRDLPALDTGDRVRVRSGRMVHVYRITATRWTSFRSQRSLDRQSAAVPGRPDADPVRAMITLSTCATPEDHAAGNYWSDRFGNPEHRIDKVGVLVRTSELRARKDRHTSRQPLRPAHAEPGRR